MTYSNHLLYYSGNEDYATHLARLPIGTYQKYIDHLAPALPARVLDVGCGVGQVVNAFAERGYEAFGVDACAPALDVARRSRGIYTLMTDVHLPFSDSYFDAVGCFTVLEHVTEPEILLREMVRVLKPVGRIVVACPNFLRVAGISAHHWHTRGVRRKGWNLLTLCGKMITARVAPDRMRFGRMEPVVNTTHFSPDDDAIIVTNPIDVGFFLRAAGVHITYRSGVLTRMGPSRNRIAEWPGVRTIIGGAFVAGVKI